MKTNGLFFLVLVVFVHHTFGYAPVSLNEVNPHYLTFRGKPIILFTSGEHYGSVLNTQFDYVKYLDTIGNLSFTLTRTWSGTYREYPDIGGIANNSLCPAPNHFLPPFKRSTECCYIDGGNKFDLSQWSDEYFQRLKSFVQLASDKGIVVNFGLFSTIYDLKLLTYNPFYWKNNINDVEKIENNLLMYSLSNTKLLAFQASVVRKLVTELNGFDNIYYEIANEPYWGNITDEWQDYIAQVITDTESTLPNKHLIARNIANNEKKIVGCCKDVSIYNFHYILPIAVIENYQLNKPIAYDETGGQGPADLPYRTSAWMYLLAGGSVFDMLDFTFYVGHEDGSGVAPNGAWNGGGGFSFRNQVRIMKTFMMNLDFLNMVADNSLVSSIQPATISYAVFAHKKDIAYALYFMNNTSEQSIKFQLNIPADSTYSVMWINTMDGGIDVEPHYTGGMLTSPPFVSDVALLLAKL